VRFADVFPALPTLPLLNEASLIPVPITDPRAWFMIQVCGLVWEHF
jgi:hypothetical protein